MQPNSTGRVRLMFEDEAGFGRINRPKRCWCSKKTQPSVPCHHIREYRYAFGGVEPTTGDHFFLVLPRCDTDCMNVFLAELSKEYPKDRILLVCDGASWHKPKGLKVPENYCSNLWPTTISSSPMLMNPPLQRMVRNVSWSAHRDSPG